jgi:hypothetical protein
MNVALVRALVASLPTAPQLAGAAMFFHREKVIFAFLQLLGAGCLVIIVLVHICEALRLVPAMAWGLQHSAGHYLDLTCAVLGVALFCVGYFLQARFSR